MSYMLYHGQIVSGVKFYQNLLYIPNGGSYTWTNPYTKTVWLTKLSMASVGSSVNVLLSVNNEYWTQVQSSTNPTESVVTPLNLNGSFEYNASNELQEIPIDPNQSISVSLVGGSGSLLFGFFVHIPVGDLT